MARPLPSEQAPREPELDVPPEDAPLDPDAVELRYRYHRARRNARVRQTQESRLANYRFYIVMFVLLALAVAFAVGSWHEIQHLFGL